MSDQYDITDVVRALRSREISVVTATLGGSTHEPALLIKAGDDYTGSRIAVYVRGIPQVNSDFELAMDQLASGTDPKQGIEYMVLHSADVSYVKSEPETGHEFTNDILAERKKVYGDPVEMHNRIAGIWSAILKHDVSAHDVALCMVGLKLARAQNDPTHEDSLIDVAGYTEIAQLIAKREYASE